MTFFGRWSDYSALLSYQATEGLLGIKLRDFCFIFLIGFFIQSLLTAFGGSIEFGPSENCTFDSMRGAKKNQHWVWSYCVRENHAGMSRHDLPNYDYLATSYLATKGLLGDEIAGFCLILRVLRFFHLCLVVSSIKFVTFGQIAYLTKLHVRFHWRA